MVVHGTSGVKERVRKMGMGYMGYALFDTDIYVPLTGVSPNINRVKIESNSGYGGGEEAVSSSPGLWSPRYYDWGDYSAGLDARGDYYFIGTLLEWMNNRTLTRTLDIYFDDKSKVIFPEVYLNNFTISASEGDSVVCSVGTTIVQEPTELIFEDNYIGNRLGKWTIGGFEDAYYPLNPDGGNWSPYPYWQSIISGLGTNVEVTNWSFTFNNNPSPQFATEGVSSSTAPPPKWINFGPASVEFSLTVVLVPGSGDTYVPENNVSITLTIGDGTKIREISMTEAELQTDSPGLDKGSVGGIDLNYHIYRLSAA